jgi:hypothetical protein
MNTTDPMEKMLYRDRWQRWLEKAGDGDHFVQFYEDSRVMAMSMAFYVANGLRLGESAVLIARKEHLDLCQGFLAEEFDVMANVAEGRLCLLDAARTLASCCVQGKPDKARFEAIVPPVLAAAKAASPVRRVRAYGEMVDLLRQTDDLPSALALEGYWNSLARRSSFALLCSYREGLSLPERGRVCAAHTHMIPVRAVAGGR